MNATLRSVESITRDLAAAPTVLNGVDEANPAGGAGPDEARIGNSNGTGRGARGMHADEGDANESWTGRGAEAADWRDLLLRGKATRDGKPGGIKPCLANADVVLRHAPEWAGALALDEFSQRVRIVKHTPLGGPVPRDATDGDVTNISIWMQREGLYVGPDVVGPVSSAVAFSNKFHPLRDWLNGLAWDGVSRVDTWLRDYAGAADDDYVSKVGRWWLISAVARVMKPGCQADYMLVLEGPQGARKSTLFQVLASEEYFSDQLPDLHTKDASLQMEGNWIIEWSEMDKLRSEMETVKSFITRKVEDFRRPYGKINEKIPRQCVFAGSTNSAEWLRDETGNRRFWPVTTGVLNLEKLAADREQLWAEAVAMFNNGIHYWPEDANWIKVAAQQAALRVEGDTWADAVSRYVSADGRDEVKAVDILAFIGYELKDMRQADRNRIGRCLRALGFEPGRDDDDKRCFKRAAK